MKKPLGIKIGCDPEFIFRRGSNFVSAENVFGGRDTASQLGTDGASNTAELRTTPGSYYKMTDEINKLIKEAKQRSNGLQAYSGSGDIVPLGGHIHFSGIPVNEAILNRLDKFIAKPLNTIAEVRTRHSHGYGRMSEYRPQPHGWEYRAPLSWLSTPIITKGALCIAWVLARASKHNDDIDTQDELLNYAYKRERIAIQMFYETIKNYKRDNVKLENIEMFKAWCKEQKPLPSIMPNFSNDTFMPQIFELTQTHTERYNPYACYKGLRLFGISLERSQKRGIFVPSFLMWLGNVKHLGCEVYLNEQYPTEWGNTEQAQSYAIGLTYKLRKNHKASIWVIKRIIKEINARHEQANLQATMNQVTAQA